MRLFSLKPAMTALLSQVALCFAATAFLLAIAPRTIAASVPSGGDAFLTRFRAAVANPDAAALADLTRLPFLFDGQAHDRTAFIARVVPRLFTPPVRKCLIQAKPQSEEGRLLLWCKPYGFYLGVADGQWRLMEFAADGEP
jgi:hypothetical protein